MKQHRICIVGSGYVGLVTGACLAELGHRVVCVDSDKKKLALLKRGKNPIYEPGLDELLAKHRRSGALRFAGSIAEGMRAGSAGDAEVVFIAVGTPPRADGSADLSYVEAAAAEVAKNMRSYTVLVDKSTVPVETGDWVKKTVERHNARKVPFDVASNPEFLSEGSAVRDFLQPDRVVLGVSSKRAEDVLRSVYAPIKAPVIVTDLKSAELIKHASNSFLATKISFINAVAELCEKTGADVSMVAEGMGSDRRIGHQFLRAGLGFGGFCFPKDLEAFYWIAQKKGYDFKLLQAVKEINERAKAWPIRQVEAELWNLEGKNVAVLGLSFKPDTDDLRFAPSLEIIAKLQEHRVKVTAYDPVAMPKAKPLLKGVRFAKNAYDAVKGADCLLLITEWKEFRELDFARVKKLMRHPIVLDGRNIYEPAKLRGLGFTYHSVGRP
jgi:UDPglucose 6-dehydrogenase